MKKKFLSLLLAVCLLPAAAIPTRAAGTAAVVEGRDCRIEISNGVYLDLVWIEPGSFMMGSPEDELGRGREQETTGQRPISSDEADDKR